MANTFTVTHEDVFGAVRVRIGTLTLTDGAGDGATALLANTGFNKILFAVENSVTPCRLTYTLGYIGASSATSGDTIASGTALQVMIFGT